MAFPDVVVGPTGKVAVASGLDSNFTYEVETNAVPRMKPENIVGLYDKDGNPLRSVEIDAFPFPSLEFDGERLILTREEGIFFISATEGKPLGWFKTEIDDHKVFVVSGGRELLVVSPRQARAIRYRMPE